MKISRQAAASALLISLMASACAGPQADPPNAVAAAESPANESETLSVHSVPDVAGDLSMESETGAGVSADPAMTRLVDLAKKDLAANVSINAEEIETVQARFVTWPDSSVGCPQPGTQYLQVLTSGALIVLKYANASYRYHSGGERPPFLCKNPSPIGPLPHQDDEA